MIELTEQQKKDFVKQKEAQFREALKKVEDDTGMTIVAFLEPTPQAITARIAIVPITAKDDGKNTSE
jgi:ribosomal protein S4